MNRREFVGTLGLLVAGAALVLLAATQTWVSTGSEGSDPIADPLLGSKVAPAARALGLVGLAAVVGVPATRGWVRRVVGGLVGLVGLGAVASSVVFRASVAYMLSDNASVSTLPTVTPTIWPWVSVAGGVLIMVAGVVTVVRGQRWPAMGTRYDAPTKRPNADNPWSALDRGEDPTDPAEATVGRLEDNGKSSHELPEHER